MFRLLSIEWLKINRYATFWVLAGMFVALLLLWNWTISSGLMKLGGNDFNILSTNYTFPGVWANVSYWTKIFSGLIAIIVIILTTNEFQYRTNRQNVIDGWSRTDFYHAKWLVVVSLSAIVTLFTFLLGIFFSVIHGSSFSHFSDNLIKIVYLFILTLNYFGFALILSVMLKRSGTAIIIFLIYCYVLELMLQQLLNWKIDAHPGNFLPLQCSADLITFPITDMLKQMTAKKGAGETRLAIASLCWITIYYLAGRYKMLKSDW